jgi:cytoskeletal protein CcmA (bactofilin family)
VAGDIETANGNIDVGADSRVDGGIRIRKQRGSWSINNSRPPTVVIGPRSVVKGALKFERTVKLYVSNSASTGTIEGAQAIKFSGDSPPRQ